VGVIAEVKRSSPSLGVINAGLRAGDQAAAFVAGGAAAVSILTEPLRFGGSPEDLAAARARVAVPILMKDFLVDVLQLVEARALGASAILLIVRALDPEGLRDLIDAAMALGLEQLVEVHTETELEMALVAGARIVGVNNRNLETLQVAPTTAARIIPEVPADLVAVAESGIASRADVMRAAEYGADAVLIGSALSRAPDPGVAVSAFVGAPRTRRRQSP
jgi:indole-3-glycerol phosphate synthase